MELPIHRLESLFAQLGLANDRASIDSFITSHAPLPNHVELADASFWTPAQASFLREEMLEDADWAEVIDELNERLRKS
jgi:hypothetical protein